MERLAFVIWVLLFMTMSTEIAARANWSPFLVSEVVSSRDAENVFLNRSNRMLSDWIYDVHMRVLFRSIDPMRRVGSVVSRRSRAPPRQLYVGQEGLGEFRSVQDAVDSILEQRHEVQPVIINIGPGIYKERVIVPKRLPFVTFQGSGRETTKITSDQDARHSGGTGHTATVAIKADNFIARDISFENSSPRPAPGEAGRQAVALMITGDQAAFYNCGFLGHQDTLYDKKGRHLFRHCYILGSIDFIFGDGLSLYEGCEIVSNAKGFGAITAQKRLDNEDHSGFSFVNCTIQGTGSTLLGRAWGPYSRVVFAYTFINVSVAHDGWSDWSLPARDSTVFYGQYRCSGPGASTQGRVPWSRELTDQEALPFLGHEFLGTSEWLPEDMAQHERLRGGALIESQMRGINGLLNQHAGRTLDLYDTSGRRAVTLYFAHHQTADDEGLMASVQQQQIQQADTSSTRLIISSKFLECLLHSGNPVPIKTGDEQLTGEDYYNSDKLKTARKNLQTCTHVLSQCVGKSLYNERKDLKVSSWKVVITTQDLKHNQTSGMIRVHPSCWASHSLGEF